ncbi:MAG: response regulator [Bacteroidota bacterium]
MNPEILIVNKSPDEQKAMGNVLSSFDLNLNYANHGSEALIMAKRMKPSLIISQISDTSMDGITMADIIRKDKFLTDVPIIFIHNELDLSLIAAAKQVDSKAFLIKPYINNSLIYAVKKVLEISQLERVSIAATKSQMKSFLYA